MEKSKEKTEKNDLISLSWSETIMKEAKIWAPAFRITILLSISAVAILVRVFSV